MPIIDGTRFSANIVNYVRMFHHFLSSLTIIIFKVTPSHPKPFEDKHFAVLLKDRNPNYTYLDMKIIPKMAIKWLLSLSYLDCVIPNF